MVNKVTQLPLYAACFYTHASAVKILLEDKRVDPNQADNDGKVPLYVSSGYGDYVTAAILLADDRIDQNKLDKDGKTPLDIAIERGYQG